MPVQKFSIVIMIILVRFPGLTRVSHLVLQGPPICARFTLKMAMRFNSTTCFQAQRLRSGLEALSRAQLAGALRPWQGPGRGLAGAGMRAVSGEAGRARGRGVLMGRRQGRGRPGRLYFHDVMNALHFAAWPNRLCVRRAHFRRASSPVWRAGRRGTVGRGLPAFRSGIWVQSCRPHGCLMAAWPPACLHD